MTMLNDSEISIPIPAPVQIPLTNDDAHSHIEYPCSSFSNGGDILDVETAEALRKDGITSFSIPTGSQLKGKTTNY